MGRTPPPPRSVTQSGGGAAGMSTGEGAEGDEPLGAASGLEQRTADLAACGYAASGAAQLVLLQAYRWALRTGASAVRPAHVAAALLTDACLPRFRSGFASHPPAQAALELFAVLPGAACHRVCGSDGVRLRADDGDIQPTATRITSTSTASCGATCSTSGARAPPTQRCWPWLEQGVMCALATASAWELAALAARLAALATAEPSWTRRHVAWLAAAHSAYALEADSSISGDNKNDRGSSSGSSSAAAGLARLLPSLVLGQRQRLQQHLRQLAGFGGRLRDSRAALLSQTKDDVGVAGFMDAGWCAATDSSSEANTTTPSTSATGTPVPEPHVVPPGSRPRRLQLPDADTVALAAALTRELPPDWLRADEMWLLHVTDRDAGMRQRLHAAGAGAGGSGADALERQWAQWLAAAGDVQLARVMPAAAQQGLQGRRPETPAAASTPAASSAPLSVTTSAALPLVLVPSHTPPSAVRPLLPPVCRLELLLARRRTQAVQTVLALMWQGDWYRGDAASLARFSASELLYVLCALVRLKEEEELEEQPLGWMAGDTAADAVLDMLACPTHAHLLAHPGVAWGVGAAHAAATAPGASAGAAAATAGAYVPSDLAAEKRVRGQKLLDAAADVDEYASRVLQALQFLAASGGAASGGEAAARRWAQVLGSVEGVASLRWALRAWGHDPDKWMATSRTRKLVESCAKLAQGSARTAEMVKLEEPQDEYGYPPADSANRLNPQQSAKAVATLLDACHMGMRAVLETANAQEQQGRSTDAGSEQPAPQQSAGKAGEDSAPAAASPATSPATSQLWRCAINVATALQDASRLLAAPATYLAYTSADPSCDALLSLGELAATAEGEGAAAGEAGSARVKAESEAPAAGGTGKGGDVEMEEAIGGAGVKPEAEAGAEAKQEQPLAADGAAAAGGWVAPSQPPDVCCLLASHGYSLLLVACEQQPESLLDSVLQQPGGAQRMQHVTSAALELAAVRQLQLVALRFAELLTDDGNTQLEAKRALLPALCEALLAEPRRCVDCNHEAKLTTCAVGMLLKNPASRATCMPLLLGCVRLPGPGGAAASQGLPPPPSAPGAAAPQQLQCPGQFPPGYLGGYLPQQQGLLPPGQQPGQPQPQPNWSAFGDNFRTERFMAVGTGDEREELYVGGRGRGYKKTRVLNPEAHGVDCDAVGLVTTAMATSLEYAVLMCKLLANASVGAPPVPLDEAADAGANSDPAAAGATEPGAQREQPAPQQEPKPEDGAGGVEVKAEPGGEEAKAGAAAGAKPGRQDLHLLPLASAFRRMLEDRYLKGQQAQQDQKVAGASSAEGSSEGEAALAALDAQALLPPGELALYAAIERVAVNLAAVLSLLQPVCPNGGQDIRASLAVLHLPTLRWPRMSVRLPQLLGVEDVELLLGVAEDLCTTTGAFSKRLQELRRQRHAERRRIRERYQLPKKQPKGHRRGEDGTSMPQLTRLLRRGAACPVGQSDSEDEAAAEQARAASGLNGLAARAPGGQPGGAHLKQTHVANTVSW
eukprot:XP_001690219.1 predicted protein [Chlamydomonas reinhardtii]